MKKLYYSAFAGRDEICGFGVSFPDFPGGVSAGESVEEALLDTQEALAA
jgi:predicted RNase H-like HicB family nuclease